MKLSYEPYPQTTLSIPEEMPEWISELLGLPDEIAQVSLSLVKNIELLEKVEAQLRVLAAEVKQSVYSDKSLTNDTQRKAFFVKALEDHAEYLALTESKELTQKDVSYSKVENQRLRDRQTTLRAIISLYSNS